MKNVLILCTGNSARSILAEALVNQHGAGRYKAFSAGSQPKGEVHPMALELLSAMGHDTSFAASKSWDVFAGQHAPQMDYVFTVCANAENETCPIWPGHPTTAHWGIPDPAAVVEPPEAVREAFAEAYRRLEGRVQMFCALPLEEMSDAEAREQLAAIGQVDA